MFLAIRASSSLDVRAMRACAQRDQDGPCPLGGMSGEAFGPLGRPPILNLAKIKNMTFPKLVLSRAVKRKTNRMVQASAGKGNLEN